MSFKDKISKAAHRSGGSHKTRIARIQHSKRFAIWLKSQNIQIKSIEYMRAGHIQKYVASRLNQGIGKRTIQNEMASLRSVLRQEGREKLANLPELTNKNLCISNISRVGTKSAISEERAAELASHILDAGVLACVELERTLGLRSEEAVKSFKSLKTWESALNQGKKKLP